MGVGTGIFLIALGAILAFGVNWQIWWLDLDVVGGVLIVAGAAVLLLTLWFWQARRRRNVVTIVEEAKMAHTSGPASPDPPDTQLRPPPTERP